MDKDLPNPYHENLDSSAYLLIIRNGLKFLLDNPELFHQEILNLDFDKKSYKPRYGVINKHTNYCLHFDDFSQDPDYNQFMPRVCDFYQVEQTNQIRQTLESISGLPDKSLVDTGNFYPDTFHCGIGYHGDSNRRTVAAVRLGASTPLSFQWFYNHKPVGQKSIYQLNHGDIYFMFEKATGFDYKLIKIATVRHAAGADKFIGRY